MTASGQNPTHTIFSLHALGFIVFASLAAIWPVFLHGGHPFTMWDSFYYMDEGDRLRGLVGGWIEGFFRSTPLANGAESAPATEPKSIRSLPYSAFVGAVLPFGVAATIWLQTCLLMTLVYAFLAPALAAVSRAAIIAGAAVMLTVTQVSFMASFFMPDILGAIVVLFAALVARGIENFDLPSQIVLGAIALFGIIAHYGNIPLAFAVLSVAVLSRADSWVRLRNAFLVVLLAIAAALGANAVLGVVAFGEVSITPGRYPILLARSIQDGPARWHLQENCGSEEYALCEWWPDEIPKSVGDALWEERGMANAPPELYKQIRDEELTILWRAFLDYPWDQVRSLSKNASRQLLWVGSRYAEVNVAVANGPDGRKFTESDFQPLKPIMREIGLFQKIVFMIAVACLTYLVVFRPNFARQRQVAMVLAVGILANAAIFGGLSAPTDRYGARIAWLATLATLAFIAERRGVIRQTAE